MKNDTIMKIIGCILAVVVVVWVCRTVSALLITIFALTATTIGLVIAFVLQYGIPLLIIAAIAYFVFGSKK